jgi:hypothetical protein
LILGGKKYEFAQIFRSFFRIQMDEYSEIADGNIPHRAPDTGPIYRRGGHFCLDNSISR